LQDYEDLARLASPEVAMAKCVPLFDLAAEPAGKHRRPGVVSVIVVPHSNDPRPMPGSELLGCVLDYLRSSSPPTAQISVVAPEYVQIDVTTEIVVGDPDSVSQIELAVKLALTGFLHPLTGGPAGAGWDFGRMPHKSDFFVVIEGVPGVSYVRDVRLFAVEEREGVEHTNRFLVSPGEIAVVPALDPQDSTMSTVADRGGL
jgi:predicted phage baseplate assembly protein